GVAQCPLERLGDGRRHHPPVLSVVVSVVVPATPVHSTAPSSGTTEIQAKPGGTTRSSPSAVVRVNGSEASSRAHVPSITLPSAKTSKSPLPIVDVAGTADPLDPAGGEAVYCSPTMATRTSAVMRS